MAKTNYESDHSMTEVLAKVIAHTRLSGMGALREHGIKVLACAAIRMDEEGTTQTCSGPPVKLCKVSDALRVYMKDKARFVLVIDSGTWEQWNDNTRMAHVYAAITGITVEKDKKGLKVRTEKPDIMEHSNTVAHFGIYNPSVQRFDAALRDKDHRLVDMVAGLQEQHEAAEEASAAPEPEPVAEEERPRIRTADEEIQPENSDATQVPDPAEPVPLRPRRAGKK